MSVIILMLSFLKYLCVVCKFFWWCCDHYEESDSSSGYFCLWRNFWIPNPYKRQQQGKIDQWERRMRINWPIRGQERSTLPAVNWAGEFWILPDWKDGRKVSCLKKMFAVNPRAGSRFLIFNGGWAVLVILYQLIHWLIKKIRDNQSNYDYVKL